MKWQSDKKGETSTSKCHTDSHLELVRVYRPTISNTQVVSLLLVFSAYVDSVMVPSGVCGPLLYLFRHG